MGVKICVGWGWGEIEELRGYTHLLLGEETYNKIGSNDYREA